MGRGRKPDDRDAGLTRREFLEVAAVGAAGVAVIGCSDGVAAGPDGGAGDAATTAVDAALRPDASPPDAGPIEAPDSVPLATTFGLGVASGDVTAQRAIVWTRYDGVAPLRMVVWEMDGDDYVRVVNEREITTDDGGFTHADVYGLTPGAEHRYAFFEMNGEARVARSEIGRLRAATPPGNLEPLLLGATSCSSNGRTFDTLAHAGARTDLDLFLLLGDTVYADGAETVDEYRASWDENLGTDAYRALRASTSLMCTWDDHEVDNDFDAESVPSDVLAAGTQAFFEHQPLRRVLGAPNRIWKSIRWGDTAELFAIDCRGERRPSTKGEVDEEYISLEQMAWLKQALADSTAVFKVILNSVPIGNFPSLFDVAANDRWEGYPSQRTEILSYIDEYIDGVIWLAGDFHLASVGRIDVDGSPGANQIEALCGPADQFANPLWTILGAPQFDWSSGTNNYATIALDPTTRTVTFTWIDGDGDPLHTQSYTL